jgi:hypothetical protein
MLGAHLGYDCEAALRAVAQQLRNLLSGVRPQRHLAASLVLALPVPAGAEGAVEMRAAVCWGWGRPAPCASLAYPVCAVGSVRRAGPVVTLQGDRVADDIVLPQQRGEEV